MRVNSLLFAAASLIVISLSPHLSYAQTNTDQQESRMPIASSTDSTNLSYSLYHWKNGWGYDVLVNGEILIHQPIIPGKAGNDGFSTEADAEKVANLVIKKIRTGEMPPGVSEEELRNLDIR